MRLTHELMLIKTDDITFITNDDNLYDNIFNEDYLKILQTVNIPDNIFSYFIDYFNWVHTKLIIDGKFVKSQGFNYYGFTLIDSSSSLRFKNICYSLIDLFSLGDDIITLTGDFELKSEGIGQYIQFSIEKNYLINLFSEIASITDELKKEGYYIIHMGI